MTQSALTAKLLRFGAPSVLGACLAALIAALAEAIWHTHTVIEALATAGFLLVFAIPSGACLSIFGRTLFHAWRHEQAFTTSTSTGASRRAVAWIVFLVFSAVVLAATTFTGISALASRTSPPLVGVASSALVPSIALALLSVSRPLVNLLEPVVELAERHGTRFIRPLVVLGLIAGLGVLAATATWFLFVVPKLGHLDVTFLVYIGVFAVGLAVLPWLGGHSSGRLFRTLGVAVTLSTVASLASASWLRYERPYKMLEVWGDAKLAGWAIDTLYDIQGLRGELSIEGIAPTRREGGKGRPPNVVVITIDTVRADHVPLYGGLAKMPALAALGKNAAIFERAFSPGNVTRRSLPTLATGLSPLRMRGRVAGWALRLDPRHILLAERFRAVGYETAGFF